MTDDQPEILKWKKHKVYRCRLCAFDSLDKKKFEDHFAKVHPPLRVIDGGKDEAPESPDTGELEAGKEPDNGNASS